MRIPVELIYICLSVISNGIEYIDRGQCRYVEDRREIGRRERIVEIEEERRKEEEEGITIIIIEGNNNKVEIGR